MFDLSKRAVVLTGATGNIGPTVLRAYLEQGAHVAIPVRDEARAPLSGRRLVTWPVRPRTREF